AALKEFNPDIVISDYMMPSFNGLQALKDSREHDPLIPFILFTGSTNEEIAVDCMKAGASDYVIKEHMTRLPFAVFEVMEQARAQKEKLEADHLLEMSHRSLNTLISHLPGIVYRCRNDAARTMEYISRVSDDIIGYSTDELVFNEKVSFDETIHYDDRDYVRKEINKAVKHKEQYHIKYRIVKKDDNIIWVWDNGEGIFDDKGNLLYLEGFITDITSQKLAEDSLKESRQLFETLAKAAPVGIFRTKADGYTTYVNPRWTELAGITAEKALGNGWLKAVHPSDRDMLSGKWNADVLQKKTSYAEYRFLRPDGTVCWVIGNAVPEHSAGKIFGYIGTITDITERHLADIELHKLSRAVEQSPVSVIITDTKGIIEYVNPKMCAVTGYSQEELIGKNPRILSTKEKSKEEYKELWDTIKSGNDWSGEFHNKKKGGELYWESATISPVRNERNEITHFLGIKEDISEKKRTEQVQKALFEISSAVVTNTELDSLIDIIKNQIGTILDSRNFYLALYDEKSGNFYSPLTRDEKDNFVTWPAGKSLTWYVVKNNRSVVLKKDDILELIKRGEAQLVGTIAECWIGVPLNVNEKTRGAFVLQSYDNPDAYGTMDINMLEFIANQISQSIQRQDAITGLREALRKAEAGDRLKTTFLNNISHEVRTPLNGILGFSELIAKPDLSEKDRRDSLDMLAESSDRLLNTITNYMDISLLTSDTLTIHNKNFSPVRVLNDIFEKYKNLCDKRNLLLILDIPAQTEDLSIYSDPEIFRKIISHFLDNAVKFTVAGTITFGFRVKDEKLEFYVRDTGIGINSASTDSIFERFIKDERGVMKNTEGSGLGLSIAKGMSLL
ncbi:MAG TPA: PAS domain S-box protein, partial [Bacteroidales bacterium]|nr:PAS domain S-box protein [Bacteroidales bacterium]